MLRPRGRSRSLTRFQSESGGRTGIGRSSPSARFDSGSERSSRALRGEVERNGVAMNICRLSRFDGIETGNAPAAY